MARAQRCYERIHKHLRLDDEVGLASYILSAGSISCREAVRDIRASAYSRPLGLALGVCPAGAGTILRKKPDFALGFQQRRPRNIMSEKEKSARLTLDSVKSLVLRDPVLDRR